MKKLLLMLGAILFASTFIVGDLFAYTYSHTTSYTRTQSRAATISTPDSMYYNPVGLVKVKDGMYIDLGDQMGAKNWELRAGIQNIYDKTPSFLIPNLGLAYKNGKGAIFLSVYVPAGGGTVNYQANEGIAAVGMSGLLPPGTPNPQYVKATSFWIQGAVGGSFALTDWFAVTAGMKVSMFTMETSMGYDMTGTIMKSKTTANGFSGFGGVMFTPMEMLNITILYSSKVIARGKIQNVKLHYTQIAEERLPDYLLMGFNVKPAEGMEIQISYQINFTNQIAYASEMTNTKNFAYAGIDPTSLTVNTGGNLENYKGRLQHKIGIGFEGQVHKMVLVSCGVSYESQDVYPRANAVIPNILDPSLKNIGVGVGIKINPIDMLSIDLGAARYFYITDRALFNSLKFNKATWSWGIGLTAKVI
jgi:long-subunit fatty acid transport protein